MKYPSDNEPISKTNLMQLHHSGIKSTKINLLKTHENDCDLCPFAEYKRTEQIKITTAVEIRLKR